MSKPEDIPLNVWENAEYHIWSNISSTEAVARAILAERERCSKIARSVLHETALLMSNPPQSAAAWGIMNAINAGTVVP
jgi:hypothetical protein